MHSMIREKFSIFLSKLGCQRLVVCNDECRFIVLSDHIGHSKGLTGSSNTEESLAIITFFETIYECLNSLRLVTGRFESGSYGEYLIMRHRYAQRL